MPLALILSSYVAASRVGGMAQAYALAPFKIDPVVVPTTLFGRHPGWGPPGGSAVDAATFKSVIEGVAANGLLDLTDVILTGYFASPEQVWVASETIALARAQAKALGKTPPIILVDPVMGDDDKGLYVKPGVADALIDLARDADIITPNLWELSRLSGQEVTDAASVIAAARAFGKPALVTSVPGDPGEIGALWADAESAVAAFHLRQDNVPRGTGDLIAALFAAWLLEGRTPLGACVSAVHGTAEAVQAAAEWRAPELPLVALGDRLVRPSARVRIETFS
ncbi:MAG TPA: PfkB family carbohydrate kinase [Caulobacteraceae bacterium]|jgi:pyridoxine kinase